MENQGDFPVQVQQRNLTTMTLFVYKNLRAPHIPIMQFKNEEDKAGAGLIPPQAAYGNIVILIVLLNFPAVMRQK